jgi:hypothetical protein
MVGRLVNWAERSESPASLAAFFSMVDRRKALHKRASSWSADHPELFMTAQVPYASIVEQMTIRRMPLAAFAPKDAAASAFAEVWNELQAQLAARAESVPRAERWTSLRQALDALVAQLDGGGVGPVGAAPGDAPAPIEVAARPSPPALPAAGPAVDPRAVGDASVDFVHTFDTGRRDLERCGYVLELHERPGRMRIVAARSATETDHPGAALAEAQVDTTWAQQILTGTKSPLSVLQCRLGASACGPLATIAALVGTERLDRIDSRVGGLFTSETLRGSAGIPPAARATESARTC